jgi:hypothetical protein
MKDTSDALAKSQLFTLTGETIALAPGDQGNSVGERSRHHAAGHIIDQKYEIIALLGEGGMGAV